ncbi:hypothetical protein ES703_99469 [subsurface metagenome]
MEIVDSTTISQDARRLQTEIDKLGLGRPSRPKVAIPKPEDFAGLYDVLIKSEELRDATRKLFLDGHYARAVEEAYKCINNTVKAKSQLPKDGQDLMNQTFSEKNPILKLNKLRTDSHRDEQIGYMHIFGGCMTGIRNPRAHEHKKTDSPEVAIEMLVWANHLMRVIDRAKRVRKPKKPLIP